MKIKTLHIFLVGIQFGGIFFITLTGEFMPSGIFTNLLFWSAIITGLWAIISMNSQTLSIFPDLRKNASLTKIGPYKLIRHPMYTAVATLLLALIINEFSIYRFVIFIFVIIALIFKMTIEEKILMNKFPEYSDYMKSTKRILPFIY